MNRRGFIGTLAALAGLALAKIKAPAKPKYVAGCDPAYGLDESAIYIQRITPDDVVSWYRPDLPRREPVFIKVPYDAETVNRELDELTRSLGSHCG